MTTLNVNLFTSMAAPKDDLSKYSNLPADLKTAMEENAKKRATAQAEAAADQILDLAKLAAAKKELLAGNIRTLRQQAADLQAMIDDVDQAEVFGYATSNFLPLIAHVHGLSAIPAGDRKSAIVPKGWAAPAAAAPAAETPSA